MSECGENKGSHFKVFVQGYGLTTVAGSGIDPLWQALWGRKALARPFSAPSLLPMEPLFNVSSWPERTDVASTLEQIVWQLGRAWEQALCSAGSTTGSAKIGVVFASTKGALEDHVWSETTITADPLGPVLRDFLRTRKIPAVCTAIVSNACTSAISALWLAQQWLERGRVEVAIVLAADTVGPFVFKGFQSLQALSLQGARPFDQNRDGLMLGEAAAAIVLSTRRPTELMFQGAGIDAEGFAVTRPKPSGESILRALAQIPGEPPDALIAHGTGTHFNDETEDFAFFERFGNRPWITGSKGVVGHTLGASGAVDFILACECLRRQKLFPLATTEQVDSKFRGHYVLEGVDVIEKNKLEGVWISSLGFGGIHAAAGVRRIQ